MLNGNGWALKWTCGIIASIVFSVGAFAGTIIKDNREKIYDVKTEVKQINVRQQEIVIPTLKRIEAKL